MKTLIALLLLFTCNACVAQAYPFEKGDTLFQGPGIKLWEGKKLKLGKGSGVNGKFAFINENRTSDQALVPISEDFSGLYVDVKEWKRVGSKYQLILKANTTYECDIQSAIDAKEIVVAKTPR